MLLKANIARTSQKCIGHTNDPEKLYEVLSSYLDVGFYSGQMSYALA